MTTIRIPWPTGPSDDLEFPMHAFHVAPPALPDPKNGMPFHRQAEPIPDYQQTHAGDVTYRFHGTTLQQMHVPQFLSENEYI